VATVDVGQKEGAAEPFRGVLGPRLIQCGLGRGLLPYHVASSSIQPFGHNRHEPKTGGCAPFMGEAATPSNTTSLGLRFTSVHPFGHNRHGPKIGWGLCPFFLWVAGSPSNTNTQCGQGRGLPTCRVSS